MANKTQPTNVDVSDFLRGVVPAGRRDDALALDFLFRRVTGWSPQMWGPSIVGYGVYHYRYDSGREGDFLATGFSPRKANLVIYVMPGYGDIGDKLARLGKHKTGKSCLYITRLADVNIPVLEEIIRFGLRDLASRWHITPS